jgi:hypothetical protein
VSLESEAAQALADLVLAVRGNSNSGLTFGTVTADNGDGSVMVRPDGSDAEVGPVWVMGSAM